MYRAFSQVQRKRPIHLLLIGVGTLGTRPHECPKRVQSPHIPGHSVRIADPPQRAIPLHTGMFQ
jgi:hypothetical protein